MAGRQARKTAPSKGTSARGVATLRRKSYLRGCAAGEYPYVKLRGLLYDVQFRDLSDRHQDSIPETLRHLQEAVTRAREAFSQAADALDALVDSMPRGSADLRRNSRIEEAHREFRRALREYSRAVNRLQVFVATGKLPQE